MPIEKDAALREIDAVFVDANRDFAGGGWAAVARAETLYAACIERYAPTNTAYAKRAEDVLSPAERSRRGSSQVVVLLEGILRALRSDIENDRLRTFTELVHASLLDDLLGAAAHFVESSYLMPAAVMAGGTLEEHLRQLASKHGIDTTVTKNGRTKPKEASALNDELCAHAKAFLQTEQSQNQAWLHIRNMAAHNTPEFSQVTEPQIGGMIDGIRGFITRHPA